MTGNVGLLLVYQPDGGRPLTVARVDDGRLIVDAAHHAILQAEARAEALSEADQTLGEIERSEVGRLRRVLALLIPGLLGSPAGELSPMPAVH